MKKLLCIVIAAATLVGCGFEVVDTGRRGIETRYGAVVGQPLSEGLHFYNPFTSAITEYSVRQDTWSIKTEIFTKDTQAVDVDFSVTYYPDPNYVTQLYQEVGAGADLVEKIIKPAILGSVKDAVGQVNADELVSKRQFVTKQALKEVVTSLAVKHVIVTDLNFTNLKFDPKYTAAVEAKAVATQEAQKAVNDTVTIKEKAKQTIETAKAQAESMRIQSAALAQNHGLVEYEIAKKWNGVLPTMMTGNTVPLLNLNK